MIALEHRTMATVVSSKCEADKSVGGLNNSLILEQKNSTLDFLSNVDDDDDDDVSSDRNSDSSSIHTKSGFNPGSESLRLLTAKFFVSSP
jgi:hypothetical protein